MMMIDWFHLIMAVLFFISAVIKMRQHQAEHFFTRIVSAGWYVVTVIFHDIDVSTVRLFSTGLIIIMLAVEVTSPLFRWNLRRKQ